MKLNKLSQEIQARSHEDLDPINGGEGVRKFLRRDARVTEEQLFGAAVAERLTHHVGESAADSFQKAFRQEKARLRALNQGRSVEEAALNALQMLTETGEVLESQRNRVYNQAFRMAQIDSDLDSLEDVHGSPEAVTTREDAIELANDKTFLFGSLGELDEDTAVREWSLQPTRSDEAIPTATEAGIDLRGFVWKPESESDGNLVVLLPTNLRGLVESVELVDGQGNTLERGRASGVANGGREHFRFELPGRSYPNASLYVNQKDGLVFSILIDDPAARREN